MKYIYSAILTQKKNKVYARIPDLPGCITTGKDLEDAINQITDAAGAYLCVQEDEKLPIPAASEQSKLERDEKDICSLIRVDTLEYRAKTDPKAVRKNVSLPSWMFKLADKMGINCSQVLQEGLMAKFEK